MTLQSNMVLGLHDEYGIPDQSRTLFKPDNYKELSSADISEKMLSLKYYIVLSLESYTFNFFTFKNTINNTINDFVSIKADYEKQWITVVFTKPEDLLLFKVTDYFGFGENGAKFTVMDEYRT